MALHTFLATRQWYPSSARTHRTVLVEISAVTWFLISLKAIQRFFWAFCTISRRSQLVSFVGQPEPHFLAAEPVSLNCLMILCVVQGLTFSLQPALAAFPVAFA